MQQNKRQNGGRIRFHVPLRCADTNHLAQVVQKVGSAINWTNQYLGNDAISFRNTYPLDSDLSGR